MRTRMCSSLSLIEIECENYSVMIVAFIFYFWLKLRFWVPRDIFTHKAISHIALFNFRSAMRSTPSPKSYRSVYSQSSSNTSRVRFEDQSYLEGAPVVENPLFQPTKSKSSQGTDNYHFRPIKKQHSSPVHLHGPVVAPVIKPEPIHYTGLSEKPQHFDTTPKQDRIQRRQQRATRGVGGDSSADEGYGDSGNESGFILGTFPRSHSEERRYQHGSLFSKTLPWEKL